MPRNLGGECGSHAAKKHKSNNTSDFARLCEEKEALWLTIVIVS